MNAFFQQHALFFSQIKEFFVFFYGIVVFVLFIAVIIELKLYFNLDVFPGIDIPLDEMYVKYLK